MQAAYSPYGQTLSSTGSTYNPHRYVGGYYDSSTKLYKFGARYYNPTDKRWTQTDPSGLEYGYVYANANPVNFTDPSGYVACPIYLCGLQPADPANSLLAEGLATAFGSKCAAVFAIGDAGVAVGLALSPLSVGASAAVGVRIGLASAAIQPRVC